MLAGVCIIAIAAALPRLEFQPGIPLPGLESRPAALPTETVPLAPISVNTLVRAMLGIILGTALVYSGYKVIRGTSWKGILSASRFIAVLGLVVLIAVGILFSLANIRISTSPITPEILPATLAIKGPKLGPLPPFLTWLVWVGLCLVIALLVVWIIRWQIQRNRVRDSISLEAQSALQALKSGESFRNVIVRCYRDMSLILKKERGVELEQTMTAQEFEHLLEGRGIPQPPISQLTRLFEAARYGYRPTTSEDEKDAFDCLNAIVVYTHKDKELH
jgi:hypothetical protein